MCFQIKIVFSFICWQQQTFLFVYLFLLAVSLCHTTTVTTSEDKIAFQKQGVPYMRLNKNLYILFLYSTQQKGYFQQINQLLLKEKFNLVKYFWSSGLAHFLEGLKGFKRVLHFSALSFLSVSY